LKLTDTLTVVGIDVGGRRKGFHAVALREGRYAGQFTSPEAKELSHWCRQVIGARVIAIDAPCRWSPDGRPRPCERQLMARGIRCFASPSHIKALDHPSDYYGWMLQGEALFQDLEPSHPLLTALPITGPCCFETFPHAITWHLRGGHATAANKRAQRSELLEQAGIDLASLTSIDRIDAALCALAAHHAAVGRACHAYGEAHSGWIVVPRGQVRREGPTRATPTLWALPPQLEQ
jgi:predicted nuclease with RNAse H fold